MKPIPLPICMLFTLILVVVALVAARWMWIHYQVEPWTRDDGCAPTWCRSRRTSPGW